MLKPKGLSGSTRDYKNSDRIMMKRIMMMTDNMNLNTKSRCLCIKKTIKYFS